MNFVRLDGVRQRPLLPRLGSALSVGCIALGLLGCSDLSSLDVATDGADDGVSTTSSTSSAESPTTAQPSTPTDPALVLSPTADLEQAIRSKADVNGPYGYVTLTPLCADCDSTDEVVQLYLVPSPDDSQMRIVDRAWVNQTETDVASALWAIDPVEVPTLLFEAMDAGKAVSWTIHPRTFLVDSWTIDGVGARYTCYHVDTSSIELRGKDCPGAMMGQG